MVAEILLLVLGFILFIYGIYHLIRRNREKYDYKKYGTCVYVGLAFLTFSLILKFQLHKRFNLLLLMAVVALIFAILRKLLLSKGFRKD